MPEGLAATAACSAVRLGLRIVAVRPLDSGGYLVFGCGFLEAGGRRLPIRQRGVG